MKTRCCGALLVGLTLMLPSGLARANTVFTLQGLTFNDGGTATGTFTTNDALTLLVAANITTSTVGTFVGTTYAFANNANTSLPDFLSFATASPVRQFILDFAGAGLTTSGGAFITGPGAQSREYFGTTGVTRYLTAGRAVAAVPEPTSLALGAIGVLGLVGSLWRGRRRPVSVA